MYGDYKRIYKPLEDQLIQITKPKFVGQTVHDAKKLASQGLQVSKGVERRTASRYGLQIDPQERRALNRASSLNAAKAITGASNNARSTAVELKRNAQMGLLGLAKGTGADALSSMGYSAGLANQRNMMNQQIYQQNQNALYNLIGTGLGLGIATFL
ncbi:MAG: hypothetical protein D6694_14990 [Gammaproteobacteria bacterium]|nr:MAG: hypothetical protein D6694_14990 [Gammaproteobacteria bacterium]